MNFSRKQTKFEPMKRYIGLANSSLYRDSTRDAPVPVPDWVPVGPVTQSEWAPVGPVIQSDWYPVPTGSPLLQNTQILFSSPKLFNTSIINKYTK